MNLPKDWCVVRYIGGKFDSVMSGLGRNRGTLDAGHTRRTAQHHAREMNKNCGTAVRYKAAGPCK